MFKRHRFPLLAALAALVVIVGAVAAPAIFADGSPQLPNLSGENYWPWLNPPDGFTPDEQFSWLPDCDRNYEESATGARQECAFWENEAIKWVEHYLDMENDKNYWETKSEQLQKNLDKANEDFLFLLGESDGVEAARLNEVFNDYLSGCLLQYQQVGHAPEIRYSDIRTTGTDDDGAPIKCASLVTDLGAPGRDLMAGLNFYRAPKLTLTRFTQGGGSIISYAMYSSRDPRISLQVYRYDDGTFDFLPSDRAAIVFFTSSRGRGGDLSDCSITESTGTDQEFAVDCYESHVMTGKQQDLIAGLVQQLTSVWGDEL